MIYQTETKPPTHVWAEDFSPILVVLRGAIGAEGGMEQDPEPVFYFVTTNAECVDEQLGGRLLEYINRTLPPEEAVEFEAHMQDCVACETDCSNWKELASAVRTFQPTKVRRGRAFGQIA
jgi:Putative zinc-finger